MAAQLRRLPLILPTLCTTTASDFHQLFTRLSLCARAASIEGSIVSEAADAIRRTPGRWVLAPCRRVQLPQTTGARPSCQLRPFAASLTSARGASTSTPIPMGRFHHCCPSAAGRCCGGDSGPSGRHGEGYGNRWSPGPPLSPASVVSGAPVHRIRLTVWCKFATFKPYARLRIRFSATRVNVTKCHVSYAMVRHSKVPMLHVYCARLHSARASILAMPLSPRLQLLKCNHGSGIVRSNEDAGVNGRPFGESSAQCR